MSEGKKEEGLSKEAEELLEKSKNSKPKKGLREPKAGQTVEEAVKEDIKNRDQNT